MRIIIVIFNSLVICWLLYNKTEPETPLPPQKIIEEQQYSLIRLPVEDENPEFIDVPIFKIRVPGNSLYADIINHCSDPMTNNDENTNVHESTHGINADIRNRFPEQKRNGIKINAFYVFNGKGVVVEEPNVKISQIMVPKKLRFYRFNTYFIDSQRDWNDQPLYILDEFTAYTNEAIQGQESNPTEWKDRVSGCLEFSIYSIALAMTIQEHDPNYFETNKQFRKFLIFNLKRAQNAYHKGRYLPNSKWVDQDELLKTLLTSEEAKPMREFMEKHLKGVWLDEPI